MEKNQVKLLRNDIIWRIEKTFAKEKPAMPYQAMLDYHFKKIPGRRIWKQPTPELVVGFAFSLCSLGYNRHVRIDRLTDEVLPLIKNTSDYDDDIVQYIEFVLCGPVPSSDVLLVLLAVRDFFEGNEAAISYLLDYFLTDKEKEDTMETALHAYEEGLYQCVCASKVELSKVISKLAKTGEMLWKADLDSLEDFTSRLTSNINVHVPISEGGSFNRSIESREQEKSSERLCMMLPQKILLGCLLLYLNRVDVSFTSFMKTVLDYTCVHMPNADWYKGLFLYDFPRNFIPDDAKKIDLIQSPIHLSALLMDEDPEEPEQINAQDYPSEIERFCLTPAAIIAHLSRTPIYGHIFYSKQLEDWFIEHGVEPSTAHDYAVITGALFYNGRITQSSLDKNVPQEPSESPDTAELERLRQANQNLQQKVEDLQQRLNKSEKQLRMANHALEKQTDSKALDEENQQLTWKNKELTAALEELTAVVEEEPVEPTKEVKFPYYFNQRVLLFGGHDAFRANLQKLLPDIRFMQSTDGTMDVTPIRSADLLCLQPNKCNHPHYWSAVSTAKTYNVPCLHLRYANAELCAKAIVECLEGLEQ